MLLAMAEVVFEVVALGFERVVVLVLHRRGERLRCFVVVALTVVGRPHGRDSIFHAESAQRVVAAGTQEHATALEPIVFANFPAAAVDDGRRCAVVEPELREASDRLAGGEGAAAEALAFVEGDLRRRLRCEYDGCNGEEGFEACVDASSRAV